MTGTHLLVRCSACRRTSPAVRGPGAVLAVWPFETLVFLRGHDGALPDLAYDQRNGRADIPRRLTCRCDRLFEVTFPY